jgi:hypothetical protein
MKDFEDYENDNEDFENQSYESEGSEGSDFEDEQLVGASRLRGTRATALKRRVARALSGRGGRKGHRGGEFWGDFMTGFNSVMKPGMAVLKPMMALAGPEGVAAAALATALGYGKKRGGRRSGGKLPLGLLMAIPSLIGLGKKRGSAMGQPQHAYGPSLTSVGGRFRMPAPRPPARGPSGPSGPSLGDISRIIDSGVNVYDRIAGRGGRRGMKRGGFGWNDLMALFNQGQEIYNTTKPAVSAVKGLLPMLGEYGTTASNLLGQVGYGKRRGRRGGSRLVGAGGSNVDGRTARAQVVREVMAERGMTLAQASKTVKDEGLY